MKILQGTSLLVSLLAGAGVIVWSLPVLANVEAECRQEAEEYGIPPEQLDDYVTGCVLSRGGNYTPDPADYNAPMEGEMSNDAGMGGDYTPDPAVQDYNAPIEGEMSNDAGMGGGDVAQ
jgi:hypothetical protein